MTKTTVNSLGQITVNAALYNIERWQEIGSGSCLFQGPFGVLDFLRYRMCDNHNTGDDISRNDSAGANNPDYRENMDESFASDMNPIADESELRQTGARLKNFELTPPSTVASTFDDSFRDTLNLYPPMSLLSMRSRTRETELSSTDVPPRAPELLRHFKDKVLSFSFPLRGISECPWQTIHLPAAMSTYAELLVSQKSSHHKLSLFHSLVSASCLYRANRSPDAIGCEILRAQSQGLAKRHLELALEAELTSRRSVKYKELLMAILSMIYLEVCQLHFIR